MRSEEILLYNSLKGLHLLEKAPGDTVARDLMGLQAQFARNPHISMRLRASDYTPEGWDKNLVKIWTYRGTMHMVPADEVGLHLSACNHLGPYPDAAWGLPEGAMDAWAPVLLEEIRSGNDTRDGLKRACRRKGMDEYTEKRIFHGWGGLIREMCYRGELTMTTGTEKRYQIPAPVHFIPTDEARRILLKRYFRRFGPATLDDVRLFFTGYPNKEMKPLLDELLPTLRRTELNGKTYYHEYPLVEDFELPECLLIPGFDQLILGYRDRSRLIDTEHIRKLVLMTGIIMPGTLLRGKIRALWKLDKNRILVTPFERLYKKDEAAIRRAVRRAFGAEIKQVEFV